MNAEPFCRLSIPTARLRINIGCVFRHPPPLATPVRALSRSYNSTRARNRMPFVCALPASPPLFLPIRTLIESKAQFMPMLCAAFSCVLAHARHNADVSTRFPHPRHLLHIYLTEARRWNRGLLLQLLHS